MSLLSKRKPETDVAEVERPRRDDDSEIEKRSAISDSGILSRGVKIDASKLSEEEVDELIGLHRKARVDPEHGFPRGDLEVLTDRERKRFGALLDKALPDHLVEARRSIEARRREREVENAALAAVTQGIPPRVPADRPPGWALIPADVFDLLGETINVGDLGVLAAIASAFAGGPIPFKGASWASDGETMLLPKKLAFADVRMNQHPTASGMAHQVVGDLRELLAHLANNDVVEFAMVDGTWRLARGERLREGSS